MLPNRCYAWPFSFCHGSRLRSYVIIAVVRILWPSSHIYCLFLPFSDLAHSVSCRPEYPDYAYCPVLRRLGGQCLPFSCGWDGGGSLQSPPAARPDDDFHGGAVHWAVGGPIDRWIYQPEYDLEVDLLRLDYLECGDARRDNILRP